MKIHAAIQLISGILTVVCLFSVRSVDAQSLARLKTVAVDYVPDKTDTDLYGNLYITDRSGNIHKYDSLGNFVQNFSPERPAQITLLDAQNSVSLFVFRESVQDYFLYDRLLSLNPDFKINREKTGYVRAATLSSDRNLWIIDDTDLSLKKYDLRLKDITINTPLDLLLADGNYDINYMREYQNLLFVNNRQSEIMVFDNLGNYKKTLPFKTDEFGFAGNELYFSEGAVVRFFDLYTLKERELGLPEKNLVSVLFSKNRLTLISEDSFTLYKYTAPENSGK